MLKLVFRANQLSGTANLTGDHLATARAAVIHHFFTVVRDGWNGKIIYNDPDDDSASSGISYRRRI